MEKEWSILAVVNRFVLNFHSRNPGDGVWLPLLVSGLISVKRIPSVEIGCGAVCFEESGTVDVEGVLIDWSDSFDSRCTMGRAMLVLTAIIE